MKILLVLILSAFSTLCYSQDRQCNCPSDSLINVYTTKCNTVYLSDSSRLYYQFNCDSIWLTLENTEKHLVFSMSIDYYPHTYRLGYHFAKEYDKYLLFRSGCQATGPCNFVLVNTENGKTIKELGELIYDTDSSIFYDFLIYFSDSTLRSITLYFVDKNLSYKVDVNPQHFTAIVPEYQFDKIIFKDGYLFMEYAYDQDDKWMTNTISVDLKKYAP